MTFDVAQQPGWYPDSDEPRRLRWWDGTAWTGAHQAHAPASRSRSQRDNRTYFLRRRRIR